MAHDSDDPRLDEELAHRRRSAGEHRLPPVIAVVVAASSYALLPSRLLFAPRLLIPVLEVALVVTLTATTTRTVTERSRWSRRGTVVLAGVMILTNLVALGMLVHEVQRPGTSGESLLVGGMQVWLTNVVGFSLLYWELDRGGPVARRELRRDDLPPADWRFSQDENDDAVSEVSVGSSKSAGWIPHYTDYAYLSLTNSSAFSPTDTMPLTTRAKALMGTQATAALLVSLLVVARAVGSLGS
ncbi:MAG: hypothetical protein JWO46_1087 [Nocardioidaceae bacterium]|nr:hypothetical protein [Nocardioidaceae bacterium]